jgi:hypothetical protein
MIIPGLENAEGTVKRMDWSNPRVRLYIEVKNESNAVTWEVDMEVRTCN